MECELYQVCTKISGSSGKSSSMQMSTQSSNCFSLLLGARLLTFRYSLLLCPLARIFPSCRRPLKLLLLLRPKREEEEEEEKKNFEGGNDTTAWRYWRRGYKWGCWAAHVVMARAMGRDEWWRRRRRWGKRGRSM